MKVVFIGTPEFAATILKHLLDNGKNIVAVITAPDKPAGRGKKIQQSAVKKVALEYDLPVLQPNNLKDSDFTSELKNFEADLQIVVAFRMLPESVWNMPPLGTFNLHGSLLPQYRGAAPINWAIINGETQTGVTTFFLKHKIDTGNIIDRAEVEITPEDNAGTLHDKLMYKGAELVLSTLNSIEAGNVKTVDQSELVQGELKEAPKLFKETCKLDWTQPAKTLHNKIRGLSPYPCAFTRVLLGDKNLGLKIFSSEPDSMKGVPGKVLIEKGRLGVFCADGLIWLGDIQLEGKKRMTSDEFLRGLNRELSIV